MRVFSTGATRGSDNDKLDYEGFLSPRVLQRFAEYMHEHRVQADGSLRDSDNWQKGIPIEQYMKSMLRHMMDVWLYHRGAAEVPDIEESLVAVLFNVQGMLHEVLKQRIEASECSNSDDCVGVRPEPPEWVQAAYGLGYVG